MTVLHLKLEFESEPMVHVYSSVNSSTPNFTLVGQNRPLSNGNTDTLRCVYTVSQKTVQNRFCQNFVKFLPILIIFDRKMAKS